jgi:hypothetical protein
MDNTPLLTKPDGRLGLIRQETLVLRAGVTIRSRHTRTFASIWPAPQSGMSLPGLTDAHPEEWGI